MRAWCRGLCGGGGFAFGVLSTSRPGVFNTAPWGMYVRIARRPWLRVWWRYRDVIDWPSTSVYLSARTRYEVSLRDGTSSEDRAVLYRAVLDEEGPKEER